MLKFKNKRFLIFLFYFVITVLGFYVIGKFDSLEIQLWIQQNGKWAPIIYIFLYVIATTFMLPSTALNLSGGALFGLWFGTLWTSIAAVIAALATFSFTRTIGHDLIAKKLAKRWQGIDAEIRSGGFFYIFSIRLLPIIPYGLVNFAAGLSSIRFRDYFWGTTLGTVLGVLPFVMLGTFGLRALTTGDILPMVGALALIGILVALGTWYHHRGKLTKND